MSRIIFRESAAPTTPASGQMTLFADTNGDLSWLDDGGNLTKLVTTGATTITLPNATDTIAVLGTQQTFTARPIFSTTIGVGSATPSTSGSGITFPATQSPSTDANTLDDYEEGTWTPTFDGLTTSPTITYTTQAATYTKIGRLVTCHVRLLVNTVSGGTGSLVLRTLPYASTSAAVDGQIGSGFVSFSSSFTTNFPTGISVNAASNFCFLTYKNGNATTSYSVVTELAASSQIRATFSYITD